MTKLENMMPDIQRFLDKITELMSLYMFDNQAISGTDEYKKISSDFKSLQKIQTQPGLLIKMSADPRQLETFPDGTVAAVEYHKDRPNLGSINFGNQKINRQVHSTLWNVEEYLRAAKRYEAEPNRMSATLAIKTEELKASLGAFYKAIKPGLFHEAKRQLFPRKYVSTPYATKVEISKVR